MAYSIQFTRQAEKDTARLKSHAGRALQAIFALADQPEKGHTLTGSLRGVRSLEFSLPGGAYRAAYMVNDDKQLCLVFIVGPHENFYKKAERRYVSLRRQGDV